MPKRTSPSEVASVSAGARVPVPPAVFVGRERELDRLAAMLERVPVAIIGGVAGIGKSALAYAMAARWPSATVHTRVAPEEPLASVLDDLRRRLAGGAVPEAGSDDERLDDLAARLEATGALCLLDDLHHLNADARIALVQGLGQRLRRGRVVATSRERLLVQTLDTDRGELELRGLEVGAARMLWEELDRLYGHSRGLDSAWQRHLGNPFLLRRAHAGELGVGDPLANLVRELSGEEREVAALLALAEVPLSVGELTGAICEHERIVRDLARRLIADVDAAGVRVHDLVREALRVSLSADEQRDIHSRLARLVAGLETLDPVVQGREVSRHLRGAGQFEEAGRYLVEHGAKWIRNGAAGDLLRMFDAIPAEKRTIEVRVVRARTLGRQLQVGAAYDELRRMADGKAELSVESSSEFFVTFAHIAMLFGDFQSASDAIARAETSCALSPVQWVRMLATKAMLLSHSGRGDEGRALLESAERMADVPRFRANFALVRAFTLFMEERAAETEEPLRSAGALYQEAGTSYQGTALALPLIAAIRAREGRIEEAHRVLAELRKLLARRAEDRMLLGEIDYLKAAILLDGGDHQSALAAFRRCERLFETGGYHLGALWAGAWAGRIQLTLGRRREGTLTLDEVSARAQQNGMLAVVRCVERGRAADPALALRALLAQPQARIPTEPRARMLTVLAAASRGEEERVQTLLGELAQALEAPGSDFLRMLAALARATLARVRHDPTLEATERRQADSLARWVGVDPEVVADLVETLGTLRLVSGDAARITSAVPDLSSYDIVLDGRTHELRR
ncbi:MAG TPA: AAA family ATPase, partial [Polyangia bacterium]|nr:AAA family ATPase [Polyangia bacterium]